VEDALYNDLLALVKLAQVRQIQLRISNTALWEFSVILLSQGKSPGDIMNALVLVKAALTNLGIEEFSTGLDDLILANKLRLNFTS
jgi:hypothetical protein